MYKWKWNCFEKLCALLIYKATELGQCAIISKQKFLRLTKE